VSSNDRLNTAAAAAALFGETLAIPGGAVFKPPMRIEDAGSLVPEWALPASKKPGWILRLHETMGRHGVATLTGLRENYEVENVDLLENPIGRPARLSSGRCRLQYAPYRIISLLIRPPRKRRPRRKKR
jgi:alpha-mannosidase